VHVSSLSVYGLAEVPRERLVDESTELESHPERRDAYSHAKVRQERLIQEHAAKTGLDLVVLRPGPLYGCTAPAFPARVGIPLAGWLLHFGGRNVVPFSHVTNCAETVALAATSSRLTSGAYNVVDDDLPTSAEYVRRYKTEFGPVRAIRAPFGATMMVARIAERLNLHGNGLIPPILTPYRAATLWGGHRFDNRKLRNAGVHQIVSTGEGLTAAFAQLRACDDEVPVTPSLIRSRDRAYGMP
jgi:nucleoside-diphosphate-sugar epimerase